ncbi:MAG: hypothetical protein QW756_07370 [Nitrososphaerota archaeon]
MSVVERWVLIVVAAASATLLAVGVYTAYAMPQWHMWPYGQRVTPYGGRWMAGGQAPYMMNGVMMGGQCPYHGYWVGQQGGGERLSIQQALDVLEDYVAGLRGDFALHEVMEFQYNFYAIVVESDTGLGAFELLVNSYTGIVSPEPGPNMMWNTKYGMHYAMMGVYGEPTADMPVTAEEAQEIALTYLRNIFGGEVGVEEPMRFYGYYTLDYMVDGEIYGMLSVNGFTGQVWPHTWHGQFIQEMEVG